MNSSCNYGEEFKEICVEGIWRLFACLESSSGGVEGMPYQSRSLCT